MAIELHNYRNQHATGVDDTNQIQPRELFPNTPMQPEMLEPAEPEYELIRKIQGKRTMMAQRQGMVIAYRKVIADAEKEVERLRREAHNDIDEYLN